MKFAKKFTLVFSVIAISLLSMLVMAEKQSVEAAYKVLDSIEYEGYTWEDYGTGAPSPDIDDTGRREVEWNMNSEYSSINNGIHTLKASIYETGYAQPGTLTKIGGGLYTKDIKYIQMRVRVSTQSHLKLYYTYNGIGEGAFSEGSGTGDMTILADGKVQGDGKWHIITFKPTSDAWVNSERILTQCWFQASDNPAVFEIDWIRFMGEGTVKATSSAVEGTIIKYDNSKYITFAKNDKNANPGVSYDPVSQSMKCNGNLWSYNCDLFTDGIGISPSMLKKIVIKIKADQTMNMKLEYRRNFNESADTSIAVDTKSFYVPGDGLWHDIELESTFDTVYGVDQIGQLCLIPQSMSGLDNVYDGTNVSANSDYYIKSVELYGTAVIENFYKYEAGTPIINRSGNECKVMLPEFVNYSSKGINLLIGAASYSNGTLTDVEFINKTIDPGRVSSSCEVNLTSASQDSEIKTFIWEMDTLKPISLNELYSDVSVTIEPEQPEEVISIDVDREVKVYVDDNFSEPFDTTGERWLSGWNQVVIGGSLERGNGMTAIIDDNSDKLPMVFVREFENMTYGEAFMNVILRFDTNVDGAKWALRCGEDEIMGFTSVDGNIAVLTPAGQKVIIENYKFANNYNIKFTFDVDKQIVDGVYVDGKLVAENISFLTPVSKINNFVMRTENETIGRYEMDSLKIYRGYKVFENFSLSSVNIPDDWENVVGTAKIYDTMLELNGNKKVRKTYTREKRKTVTEFYLYMPSGREGFKVSINDGDKRIGGISSTNEGFAYFSGNSPSEEFYKQLPNVMYNFRLETDFENHSMDVFMNNRLMKAGIPLPDDVTGTDNLTVENASDGGNIYFTNVTVKPVIEYDDYCPEPQMPAKDDYEVIMQMCPMWSEGNHFGYDHLNASPSRKPLLGFYDESEPEAMDWMIKYMVEHGVDARMSVWYPNGGVNAPVREYTVNPQYKAMQNAKYADKMKWCILWENSSPMGLSTAEQNLNAFLKYVAPYWIEYYFKDPNYYKIDGRPVIGMYNYLSVIGDFTDNTKTGLDQFRQMCIDAGVGNPLLMMDVDVMATDSEKVLDLINEWGIDLHTQYHQGRTYFEESKISLEAAKNYTINNKPSFQAIPVISAGFDDFAWGRSTGILWDKSMLITALEYVRDEFFVGLPMKTGKKLVLLATWDEYAEGHYFAPTKGTGFDFLDAVRETFVGGEHTDILPTEHQLERINNRYPSWREAPYINEEYTTHEIPENTYVKKSWNFNTAGDFGGWQNSGGFNSLEARDGCLVGTGSGRSGMILLNLNGEECSDVVQVRVKYRNGSSAYNARLYYRNQFMGYLDEARAIYDHMNPYGEGEIVFSTEKYPLDWRGMLYEMRLTFDPMGTGEQIYIDSIEMIARKPSPNKMKLNVNGYVIETSGSRVADSDDAMVPIEDLAWLMRFDDRVYIDTENNVVMYRSYSDNRIAIMPIDGSVFTINGTLYPSANYYKVFGDGKFRVSGLWIKKVLGKHCSYDRLGNTFYIEDRSIEERTLVWSTDFTNDMEGFTFGSDTSGWVENGMFRLSCRYGDPQLYNTQIAQSGIDCKNAKHFAIKTTANSPCLVKVYFKTSTYNEMSEENSFIVSVPATSVPKIFSIDLTELPNWDGEIQLFRVDIEKINFNDTSNNLNIDYIRLYGDYETEIY